MESIKRIKEICMGRMSEGERMSESKMPYVRYFTRPMSFYFTKIFLTLGVTANQATFIGILISCIYFIFFSLGGYWNMIIGAVILQIWLIMDGVDGNIARYRGLKKGGGLIDSLGADFAYMAIFLSLGIGVYNTPGHLLSFLNPGLFIIFGAVAALSKISTRYTKLKLRFTLMEQKTQLANYGKGDSAKTTGDKVTPIFRKITKWINFYLCNQAGYLLPLILVCVVFSVIDVLVIFEGIVVFLIYVGTVLESIIVLKEKKLI